MNRFIRKLFLFPSLVFAFVLVGIDKLARSTKDLAHRGTQWLSPGSLSIAALALGLVLFPSVAFAGPIEDLLNAVVPGLTGMAWWAELVAAVVAGASLFAAATPKGEPGGLWDKLRGVVNWLASNVGNARNEGE